MTTTDPLPDDTLVIEAEEEPTPAVPVGTRTPFTLPGQDDVILWAVRPKNVTLMMLGASTEGALETQDPGVRLESYRLFMGTALDPKSADLIWARLDDAIDSLDAPDMDAMIKTLMVLWLARPTGQRSGPVPLPRTRGTRSTARARSKGQTPKP